VEGEITVTTIKWLRLLGIVNLLTMLAQAVFAGRMLGGDDLSANLHEKTAKLLVMIGVAQLVLMIVVWHKGQGSLGLVRANAGTLLAEILEFALGHFHHVAIHVPLGLAIFGGTVRQVLWVMSEKRATVEKVAA
jgi:hypothetical protein